MAKGFWFDFRKLRTFLYALFERSSYKSTEHFWMLRNDIGMNNERISRRSDSKGEDILIVPIVVGMFSDILPQTEIANYLLSTW